MVRFPIVFAALIVCGVTATHAQTGTITGMISGHIGATSGGDTESAALTPGASLAVVEATGWGAELDLFHARSFAGDSFDESGLTTLMLNVVGMWPATRVRPFGSVGAGLLRVRASLASDADVVNRTDWAFNAGGGVLYLLNDGMGVRGDVRYVRYLQRHDDVPLNDSGFFDFWRTTVGVTWTWPIR